MDKIQIAKEKRLAAEKSLEWVKPDMVVGLGSGSTSAFMIKALGEKVRNGLKVVGVPSSTKTQLLAEEEGIPLVKFEEVKKIDVYIDGADEFDADFRMIKGGGGALLREKILAYNSDLVVIIADSTKKVVKLNRFPLPIEVIPLARKKVQTELLENHYKTALRKHNGNPFVTDEANYILDLQLPDVTNFELFNNELLAIPGVVETGLFLDYADIIIVGHYNEIEVLTKSN